MKHFAKTFALLAICCLTFFTACHEDNVELIPENAQSQKSSVKRITLEDLKRNTQAYNKVQKYLREDGIASRAIYNADNDFWIDIDNIIETEQNGYSYYTLHVFREEPTVYTEYLYLHPQTDNTYLAFLVQCKLTAQELKGMETGIAVTDIDEKTIYTPLDGFDTSSVLNRSGLSSFIAKCTVDVIVTEIEKNQGDKAGCDKPDCLYEYSYTYANPRCEYSFSQSVFIDDPGMNNPVPWQGGNGSTDPFNPSPTLGSLDPQITLTVPSRWFFTELTPEQKAVWQSDNTSNKTLRQTLTAFLTAREYDDESCEIAKQILQMVHDTEDINGALDIIDIIVSTGLKIDVEKSLKSPCLIDLSSVSGNSPAEIKFRRVYNKLLQSPKFKELFINMFGVVDFINVKFKVETPTISGANGTCQLFSYSTGKLHNEIKIDPTHLLSNSEVYIADTIIHELLHAFLNVKLRHPSIGMSVPNINNMDFAQCINQVYNGFIGSQDQHNFMVNYLAPIIAEILSDLKTSLLSPQQINRVDNPSTSGYYVYYPNNAVPPVPSTNIMPWNWNDYLKYMSLQGLHNCTAFQYIYPNNSVGFYYYKHYFTIGEAALRN